MKRRLGNPLAKNEHTWDPDAAAGMNLADLG